MEEHSLEKRLARRLASLTAVLTNASDRPGDLNDILTTALTAALEEASLGDCGSVYLMTPVGKTEELRFFVKVKWAVDGDPIVIRDTNRQFPVWRKGQGIAGLALERKRPVFCNSPSTDNSYVKFNRGPDLSSLLAVPLVFDGKALAVMCVHNTTNHREFKEEDARYIEAICNAATLSVLANYNDLTLLPNRRLMRYLIYREMEKATQNAGDVSVVFLDLDNFGDLNGKYGWVLADQAIVQFSHIITEAVDRDGQACHRHGDEFALIFPRGATVAAAMAETILQKVRDHTFTIDKADGTVATEHLTASMGLSAASPREKDKNLDEITDDLVSRAGAASRTAKVEHSKDCLYVEGESEARK